MMASLAIRHRSSTSASTPQAPSKASEILRGLLEGLSAALRPGSQQYPSIAALVKPLGQIRQHVGALEPPSPPQDDFRHLHGFQSLLEVLRAFSGYYDPRKRTYAEVEEFFALLEEILKVLLSAFQDHPGNKRYFRYRVEGGGWESLEQVLASIGLGGADTQSWTYCLLFGKLLAFSLRSESFDEICQARSETLVRDTDGETSEDFEHITRDEALGDPEPFESRLQSVAGPKTMIAYPEILRAVVGFWVSIPRAADQPPDPAAVLVLSLLSNIISVSVYNRAALHGTDALSRFLRFAFDENPQMHAEELELVRKICKSLAELGMNDPADTQYLLSSPSEDASEFCLELANRYTSPPFFQFDLSLNGFCAIELSNLGRSFPPQSAAGYTFTAWFYVNKFDPNAHTTIFGVYDASQTCFLLVYLEKDTRNFILQTSVTSSKPSVRFKAMRFAEDTWYHIALVHRRPKAMSASKASLYVNGELAEQLRCSYPTSPPFSNGSTESFASFTSSNAKQNPVQAFLGTPRDLSNQIGRGLSQSRWALASAHLIEDVLSDDFLAVHHGLGPRYQGNFQDSLGSFQTYQASAALGLRDENNTGGKNERSEIIRAIREKASNLLPESKIMLSILPTAIFREDVHFHDTSLLRNLPRIPMTLLRRAAHKTESPLAANAALPYLPDALQRVNGLAYLNGGPVVALPAYLDTNLWRLGGFTPVALKLLERASTEEEILRSVEIMFECIQNSWRNSEAMERDSGYGILSMLLRSKMGFPTGATTESAGGRIAMTNEERDRLGLRLLSLILGFVGYNHARPLDSYVVNQLAYRVLLIDLDIWRKMNLLIQELYYRQFTTFGVYSTHSQFNGKRLQRMRIVKRLLDAVKSEPISEEVLPDFLQAFKSLVTFNCSKEVMRYLALFITYALHQPSALTSRTPRSTSAISRSSTPAFSRRPTLEVNGSTSAPGSKYLTRRQVGIRILAMYSDILCTKGDRTLVGKFAQTVTNRWLLYLLSEDDAEIVVHGCKILARVLVTHGPGYTSKFANKSGGFTIMAQRLRRWWDVPTLWPICLSILFGLDVAEVPFARNFDFFTLLEIFSKCKVIYPDSLIIITSMLQHGLKDVLRHQSDPDSPQGSQDSATGPQMPASLARPRSSSMELSKVLESRYLHVNDQDRVSSHTGTLQTVTRFLSDLFARSQDFRDFALGSEYLRLLLTSLYPAIVSADPVSAEMELNSRDSALSFEGGDVIIRPMVASSPSPIVRTSTVVVSSPQPQTPQRGTPLRKASSFILLTPPVEQVGPSSARLKTAVAPTGKFASTNVRVDVLEGIMELVINVFLDQVLVRKEFSGFGLALKVPPGFQEHQAYFESYVLRNTISHLNNTIQLNKKIMAEPKVLTNMARFHVHVTEAVFGGWFIGGSEVMIDFAGGLLEHLQQPEVATLKSVRLCSSAISTVRSCFLKILLLRMSDIDGPQATDNDAIELMSKILYWLGPVLSGLSGDDDNMKLLCYQLYSKLVDRREIVRASSAGILRILFVQKPEESYALLRQCLPPDHGHMIRDFLKVTEVDDETFLSWVDKNRRSLDALFFGGMSRTWEEFVAMENQKTSEAANGRLAKRRERLKLWHNERISADTVLLRHEMDNAQWTKVIYNSEHSKHQRLSQDQQDDLAFMSAAYAKMEREMRRPGAVFSDALTQRWKHDQTEGRNRMRIRLLPDYLNHQEDFQPKRKGTDSASSSSLRLNTSVPKNATAIPAITPSPGTNTPNQGDEATEPRGTAAEETVAHPGVSAEDDFEMVDDPNDDNDDAFEDKNRKVMRQLERGDSVLAAFNVSRIIGLEACEGICIVGKDALYIMDNVFQCATGEIVNVWDAPRDERDPFSQIVTDAKTSERRQNMGRKEQDSRNWRWHDVISISKRRFLFRDVGIEVFFTDGRSYLLTAINPSVRDELFQKLLAKAPHTNAANTLPNPEDAWRLEVVKAIEDSPQGFGSRLGSIFNASPWNPVMKRWQKGEISNFHYLMMVNTMAGRTFNDLTQYPVFPWVIADYTSDELDLNNPATFRDLSKPMGAQTPGRVSTFRESYNALAEIGETPFHYGTHYSSAMIVASYLIRLPPFVQSFILLQGGTFDHADRLFQSIPGAWKSASQDNKTDIRELIPEFFCLPEFLTNINGYNFGTRQSNGGRVDHVELPPWAKGDPRIFIQKNREALESPYVSQNLHNWIDLIFGYKQRGEAAVENLNVFHHLSYGGAADLDKMSDPKERAITAGVIHNFGQTPFQVFAKPHPPREVVQCPIRRLDTAVFALGHLPTPLMHSGERVSSLIYSAKQDRLMCAAAFRVNFSPFDKFLEWGYADNSLRFYYTESRKLAGLYESFHMGQISSVCFADSKTLITAGEDCVIAVHSVQTSPGKPVDLQLKSSLFGHKTAVRTIVVSKALSTFLSVSEDGQAFLWDLNRLQFIRKLPLTRRVECARIHDVSGEIMLCSGPNVVLYTLNGSLLLDQKVCEEEDDFVHCCTFYEGASNEWLQSFLVFTGHRRGRVKVWRKVVQQGKWTLELLRCLDHTDPRSPSGANIEAAITCVSTMPHCVYTGDEDGRVFEWNILQRDR